MSNRRSEYRLAGKMTVFVEARSASPEGSTPAAIIICSGIDISANGLQVIVDNPLPVGAILRLGADPGGDQQPLYVVGEVRWVRPEQDHYAVGFALFDSDGTDIVAWKELIALRLRD